MLEIPLPHVWSIDRNIERDDLQYETNDLVEEVQLIRSPTEGVWNHRSVYSSGNLGNRWRYGHVTIRSDNQYQVAFEGIVGTSFQVRGSFHQISEEIHRSMGSGRYCH